MRLISCLTAVTVVCAVPAQAESWRVAAWRLNAAPAMLMYVDQDSVKKNGTLRQASVVLMFDRNQRKPGEVVRSISTIEVDCSTNRSRVLRSEDWDQTKVIRTQTSPRDWFMPKPGSLPEDVAHVLCGTGSYLTGKVSNPATAADIVFRGS